MDTTIRKYLLHNGEQADRIEAATQARMAAVLFNLPTAIKEAEEEIEKQKTYKYRLSQSSDPIRKHWVDTKEATPSETKSYAEFSRMNLGQKGDN